MDLTELEVAAYQWKSPPRRFPLTGNKYGGRVSFRGRFLYELILMLLFRVASSVRKYHSS